jgi:hypothetical protein
MWLKKGTRNKKQGTRNHLYIDTAIERIIFSFAKLWIILTRCL